MQKYDTVIYGYYGQNNVGDDYIMASVINTVLKSNKNDRIGVFVLKNVFDNYNFPQNIYFLQLPQNKILRQLFIMLQVIKSNKFIIGGGGLWTNDSFGKVITNYFWIFFANIFKTDVSLYGVELTKIRNEKVKGLWSKLINKIDMVNTRTCVSFNILTDMAKENDRKKITFSPDITFAISDIDIKKFQKKDDLIKEKYILWALAMPWNQDEMMNDHYKKRYNRFIDDLYSLYLELNKIYPGVTHLFVPFLKGEDNIIIEDLISKGINNYQIYQGNTYTIRELFAEADFSVCMRFHSIIFSLFESCKFIAISYSPKTTNTLLENDIFSYIEFGIRDSGYFYKEFDLDTSKLKTLLSSPNQNTKENLKLLLKNAKKEEKIMIDWLNN